MIKPCPVKPIWGQTDGSVFGDDLDHVHNAPNVPILADQIDVQTGSEDPSEVISVYLNRIKEN